jgi:mono/diheme cytochrome c family protein
MRNIIGAALLGALAIGLAGSATAQPRADLVKRGEYLVLGIAGCNDCHTVMTPRGPDMAHTLQGAPLGFAPTAPIPWAPIAPPIAGGPVAFSEAQFVAFLQTGVRPDGSRALPPMPAYRMNADDARAVAAYVMSLPR